MKNAISGRAVIIWALCASFSFYEYFLQVSPSVMVPELMQSFQVHADQLGNMAAFFFYAYAIMQIPVGVLLDRFGPRRLLTLATLTCGLGCCLFAIAHNLQEAEAGRLLLGIGASFSIIGALKLNANWFPLKHFAFLTGLLVTVSMTGAMGGSTLMVMLINQLGWRLSIQVLAAIGCFLSILIFLIVRDHPPSDSKEENINVTKAKSGGLMQGIAHVISDRQSWLTAIYGGLAFAPTPVFAGLWGVPYLTLKYSLTRSAAGNLIALVFLGWVIGGPFFGWLTDRIKRRLPPLYIGSAGAMLVFCSIVYLPPMPHHLLAISLFLFGFFNSGFVPSFSLIRELHTEEYSASTLGFMNTLNTVGPAMIQPLVRLMLDYFWSGEMLHGTRFYSLHDFQIALSTVPVVLALSLVCLPFVKETFCRSKK